MARIGLLTGGGDCPGLNPVIRAIVRKGIDDYGHEIFGFRKGWKGVLDNDAIELTRENTSGILHRGGTILGTSRTNVYKTENGEERVLASLKERGIDVLIPIGGDDTLGVARKLFAAGFPTVGVPKTIDNDLNATDFTFGFQTAVQIATEAIDRLHSTAESHDRVIVCEVMGRDAGWIACWSGMAGGADVILVPERPFDLDEVCEPHHATATRRPARRSRSSSSPRARRRAAGGDAATAADTVDSFGHARLGGIAVELEKRDRGEDRLRVPRDGARPHPARRLAGRLRPRPRHPLRRRRDRRRLQRRLRQDGRAARHRDRARRARGRAQRAQAARPRSSSRPPRSSSASGPPAARPVRALVQRVARAAVRVDGEVVAQIGPGLLVLLGVTHDDDEARRRPARRQGPRAARLRRRRRPDERAARRPRGARASASSRSTATPARATARRYVAAAPAASSPSRCTSASARGWARGRGLRRDMEVELVNDGPVTLLLESSSTA